MLRHPNGIPSEHVFQHPSEGTSITESSPHGVGSATYVTLERCVNEEMLEPENAEEELQVRYIIWLIK